jgi:hypothetical protein
MRKTDPQQTDSQRKDEIAEAWAREYANPDSPWHRMTIRDAARGDV